MASAFFWKAAWETHLPSLNERSV